MNGNDSLTLYKTLMSRYVTAMNNTNEPMSPNMLYATSFRSDDKIYKNSEIMSGMGI